jgi:hypothetical protein
MGLTYHYAFSAPGTTPAAVLEDFLHDVEADAKELGFDPALVLNAAFDTPERQKFARQLTTGARLESDKLKGVVLLRDGQVWSHDPVRGSCRIIPKSGVLLVVTDAQKRETVFGFFQFPATLQDLNGKNVVTTHLGNRWTFQDFVNSPDPRFRQIVKRFTDAGHTDHEKDEFVETRIR